MKEYKYNSVAEMFRDVLGEDAVTACELYPLTCAQIEKNIMLNKAICNYVKTLEDMSEATKCSILQFV